MIAEILPPGVASCDAFGDFGPPAAVRLFPEEAAAVEGVVAGRLREFTTVRGCARAALARLGLPPAPLVPGHGGAPQWPSGVVGSMTHCSGYRAAAVAPGSRHPGIGIDAEPDEPLPAAVARRLFSPAERAALAALEANPGRGGPVAYDRLAFCAKEAAFKAWFPLTGRPAGPLEVEVLPAAGGTFTARPPGTPAGEPLHGRWAARDGLLVAAVVLTAPA
ncbi:4'-phosphopantetheinyl transferase superfamily protein [Streptomyces sp. VNUA116]|uniref:4'-phosphopantetheinyl transferase family protein n=1 Tax=Streptomyces sp. VNUA116 TaxID=3062449 RepID=UPI0026747102|nr:4'-phosphopantetheinyl transferase superfamily protein [Streptomyces sp. VNUA116]WKU48217.1 4'-phosphopantetheinyl transferase superfamily protein [Streptomyces sp. VNUA116]